MGRHPDMATPKGIRTARSGEWSVVQVKRVLERV
jgi:hypothetical protein